MGVINRLCIRQLKKAERIITTRIALAETTADRGYAEWELHAEALRRRRIEIQTKIESRLRAEGVFP